MNTITWAIITGEYPPQPGGVSGYTWVVAHELAARGDDVHVFAPGAGLTEISSPVHVHRLSDRFGSRGRRELFAGLDALPQPRQVLLQFVLQSFGARALNVPFVRSLRRLRGSPSWFMFHEFALDDRPDESLLRRAHAYATRVVARMATRCADLAFISIPAWQEPISRVAPACPIVWLPIPSNIATSAQPEAVAAIDAKYRVPGGQLIGHFGTYRMRDSRAFLAEALPRIARVDEARRLLLLGRGGDAFAATLIANDPALAGRIVAPGDLASQALADHLCACDVLIQPYSDGATTRRGSLIAGLALGIPTVTTLGPLSEDLWQASNAALFAPPNDVDATLARVEEALASADLRRAIGRGARELYEQYFDVAHTVDTLRATYAARANAAS